MMLPVNWPPAGRYILAVSGGADSMVLLDLMADAAPKRGYELVVAHFDHGLRADSAADRQLVADAAARYGLPFESTQGRLGQASEAVARTARHAWLGRVAAMHHATVITAHHQDDLIETSLLNLARGSGRRGLAPMQTGVTLRPLLGATRAQLRQHAAAHHIIWREDSTNADLTNPRNFLRLRLLPPTPSQWRSRYINLMNRLSALNKKVAQSISDILEVHRSGAKSYSLPRPLVRDLSLGEFEELLMAAALTLRPGIELDHRVVQEVALFAKTSGPHRRRSLRQGLDVVVETAGIRIEVA